MVMANNRLHGTFSVHFIQNCLPAYELLSIHNIRNLVNVNISNVMDNATLTPNQELKCTLYYFSISDILHCIDS